MRGCVCLRSDNFRAREEQPAEKLQQALMLVKKELEISQLQNKIATQIEEKVSNHQRDPLVL